jgi:hypothetical protein
MYGLKLKGGAVLRDRFALFNFLSLDGKLCATSEFQIKTFSNKMCYLELTSFNLIFSNPLFLHCKLILVEGVLIELKYFF